MKLQPPDRPLSDGVVTLRPWTLEDVPAIAAACADEEISRWIHQLPSPYRESDAREYVLSTQAAWRDGLGAFFAVVDGATGASSARSRCTSSTGSSRTSRSATGRRRRRGGGA